MRGKNLVLMCLMAVLLTSPIFVNFSFAQDDPLMFISPATITTNPTQSFNIQVYLINAVDISAWEFKITWDIDLTEFPPVTVEGGFFTDQGYGTHMEVVNSILYRNVLAGCFMTEPGSITGEGTLAGMKFTIKATESGSSPIHIAEAKLWDSTGTLIIPDTADGFFGTTKPKPIFYWYELGDQRATTTVLAPLGNKTLPAGTVYSLPNAYVVVGSIKVYVNATELTGGNYSVTYTSLQPITASITLLENIDATDIGESYGLPFTLEATYKVLSTAPLPGDLVTFDATRSYDPNGGNIVAWAWDFGDGSTGSGMIVTHTYAGYREEAYHVKLTVTDDNDMASWFVIKDLRIWRDLGIVSVWPSMDEWDTTADSGYQTYVDYYMDLPGLLWLLITVVNFGTQTEAFHLECYMDADTSVIGDEFAFVDIYDFDPGLDWAIGPGAGTGFGCAFLLDVSYGAGVFGINDPVPPGDYTITAIMTSDFDQDLTNNVGQVEFGLHGSVEVTRMVRGAMTERVYKMKHGPIVFGGFVKNFDNTYDILRAADDQGEYAVLVLEIMGESGSVARLESDVVYLDYLEENLDQLTLVWSDAAVGSYIGQATCYFGTDPGYLPYWGEKVFEFTFSVVP